MEERGKKREEGGEEEEGKRRRREKGERKEEEKEEVRLEHVFEGVDEKLQRDKESVINDKLRERNDR